MRKAAFLLNGVLLLVILSSIVTGGRPHGGADVILVALFLTAPASSLVALLVRPEPEGLVSIYLERRRLEELKRVRVLKRELGGPAESE